LWPDGTLTPKQAQEVKSEVVGDQKTFEYESDGNGASAATEGALFCGVEFELGTREPDLIVVLRYSRLAGIPMESIVDDLLSLPD
jgi:hypothetical protein